MLLRLDLDIRIMYYPIKHKPQEAPMIDILTQNAVRELRLETQLRRIRDQAVPAGMLAPFFPGGDH